MTYYSKVILVFIVIVVLAWKVNGFQSYVADHNRKPNKACISSRPSTSSSPAAAAASILQVQTTQLSMSDVAADGFSQDDPTTTAAALHHWEMWCLDTLEAKYKESLQIKCPFFRRRASNLLEAADTILRKFAMQHQSIMPPPVMCGPTNSIKSPDLQIEQIMDILKNDWRTETNKGYYITGRLTKSLYRDDCYFDGPDPDMPAHGLRLYLTTATQIFEYKRSYAKLLSMKAVPADKDGTRTIVATWQMVGVLRLPWKPVLPEVHGETTYYLDDSGLIYKHVETWNLSVYNAFMKTFLPQFFQQVE
jgi:Uncharacterized conserved protein (DUF2358)